MEIQRIMVMMTGTGICVIIISMAIYMIVKANNEIEIIRMGGSVYEENY